MTACGLGLPEKRRRGAAHPDADLLTAFAEQALSATERDGVLEHLALCGDCREVVALALPAEAPAVAATPEADRADSQMQRRMPEATKSRLSVFAWPTLRWAALAAGVALAASVFLLRSDKQNVATLHPASPPVAVTAPPTAVPQAALPSMDRPARLTRSDTAKSEPELFLSKKRKADQAASAPVPAQSGVLIADNKRDKVQADRLTAGLPAGVRAFDDDASARAATTEAVEVSGAAVTPKSAPSTAATLMARNEAPAIEKAKPAFQGLDSEPQKDVEQNRDERQKAQATPVSRMAKSMPMRGATALQLESMKQTRNVTWTITSGILLQSTDSGHSWQNAVRANHPLLCYASHDEDVWTGGQAGTLFHSADGGLTWAQVQPAIKTQPLSADVIHIDVRGPAEVVVSTSNNETWTTTDDGKTWEKYLVVAYLLDFLLDF